MKQLIAIAGTILLLTACSSKKNAEKGAKPAADRNKPVRVEAYIVNARSIIEKIEVPGSLLPFESTELRPEISGRVTNLYINEGSYVKKGALLVKLFDGDLRAQVNKLKIQLGIAETTADRYGQLSKIGGISQQEYDLSKLEISNIKADIGLLETDIRRTEVRAPYDGRIGLRSISLGAYVTPATPIATIQQVEQLKLEFSVPEVYTSRLQRKQPVSFQIEGYDKPFKANIIATEASVTAANRSLMIRAVVKEKNERLVPGSFARVYVNLGADNNALLIPSQAVIPQARGKQVILYKGGLALFSEVRTSARDSAMVQITEGLEAGDTVVTTGLLAIKPNAKIELSKISNTAQKP